ncbi:hypothetical protein SASPL_126877 [Salvia splendens]|uniref:BHLH domain-containing protein n=1 Tax=Salvia splendens TaxID=180675 RepID=A0A8X8XKC1_SALSN|nr:transcription factor bHLH100-like [Salvia splendens]KAG6414159.1 hypothetical protein SASPL_126877 [Salvia splendens]
MLAISPQFCSYAMMGYEEENLSYFCRERRDTSDLPIDDFTNGVDGDKKMKKLNHNASERDRRKKMNTLYANLRSLLPPQDHYKKLSIPATISRVLNYITELQAEVERLKHKKERFISKISDKNHINLKKSTSNSAASATPINDVEVVIQICIPKAEKGSFSEAISRLEEDGFLMVNASCFQSFQSRLFYNLHFQAQDGQVIDAEKFKEKLWPLI